MDLDRALELAVVSAWNELAVSGEVCSIHVEYPDVSGLPLRSLQVWMIKNRGYGYLICNYSATRSGFAGRRGTSGNTFRKFLLLTDVDSRSRFHHSE